MSRLSCAKPRKGGRLRGHSDTDPSSNSSRPSFILSPKTQRLANPHSARTPSETSPGYLGFTSFSAVYRETQDSLSLISSSWVRDDPASGSGSPHDAATTMSSRKLEDCLAVLQQIPDQETALFLKHTNPNDGWIRGAARRLVESLRDAFKRELRSRRPTDLEKMAHLISANTSKAWDDAEPDTEKWLASFCGRNLRWDSLGILFTYCKLLPWALRLCIPSLCGPDSACFLRNSYLE